MSTAARAASTRAIILLGKSTPSRPYRCAIAAHVEIEARHGGSCTATRVNAEIRL